MLLVAEKVRLLAGLGLVVAAMNLAVSIFLTRQLGMVGPVIGNLVAACSVQLVPMIVLTRGSRGIPFWTANDSQPQGPWTESGASGISSGQRDF